MIHLNAVSGILGSVLAKEGGISDFFSGAFKVLFMKRNGCLKLLPYCDTRYKGSKSKDWSGKLWIELVKL